MNEITSAPQPFIPRVFYKDPRSALAWLERAFGFQTTTLLEDPDGNVGFAEMTFQGNGRLMISGEGAFSRKSPLSAGGVNTAGLTVEIASGIDAHCERARAAGAEIVFGPEDQFYGYRDYNARDPEGHVWNFSQKLRDVSDAEMAAASGLKVSTSL
jgi:uncharacterized glyoxalase superfamily protein PhnB